ncbi:fasciclin domain-containing protein [Desulfatitalea alkaliphila]|uniref:Fasciclin domain-containing protein n=1 Tax=Desulfatitalea alkaliphila TaxID=2929485 RepID=A0AA41R660_9BACT|nr:fasciclin domain-containing protein [Desulfatitalea alkaliphila]MCJ8501860.1 fasciclin domain-containing protein [Desulfatitalea alkaliphila]
MIATLTIFGCSSSSHDSAASGGASDGHGTPAPAADIVDTAVAAGDFTTLVSALQATGLDEALRGPGPFTVFAPTDNAFAAIPATALNDLVTAANKAPLRDILLYHVFDGEVRATEALMLAQAGESVPMLNGDLLALDLDGGNLVLNIDGTSPATVVITDIVTSNGVIHVIDTVLSPADGKGTIVDKLINLGNYTTLVFAVQTAGLEGAISGPGPLTLFAPTDEAFAKIPSATINALLADIPTLTDLLTYHVNAAEIFAVDAIAADGTAITMLNGDDVSVDLVGDALTLNTGGSAPAIVTATDFIATNGIVHAIDTVISPADAP